MCAADADDAGVEHPPLAGGRFSAARPAGDLSLIHISRAVFEGERVVEIRQQVQNRARQLIEEFMIATNECSARFLAAAGGSSLRRVVRSPERWMRIVEVARKYGESLPKAPDSVALAAFLAKRHRADPLRFPDLSLVIVKLMGSGEYVLERPELSLIHISGVLRGFAAQASK